MFKPGDKVIVNNDADALAFYDASVVAGRSGTVIQESEIISGWRERVPGITDKNKMYLVDVNGIEWWIFDIHLKIDIDSLPYDEWVLHRDWNKIYRDKTEALFRKVICEQKSN